MKKKKIKKLLLGLRDFFLITLGSAIYAFAFDWLFEPNNIVMCGFTGLAQTINRLVPSIPIGLMVIAMNVPLFVIGIRLQGIRLLFTSLYAMLTSSVFIDVIPHIHQFEPIDDHLVVCIFGGALVGVASAIQLMVGATTGGTELSARLLKYKFKHVSIGKLCLMIDLTVIVIYTIVYKNVTDGLYAAIAMYIASISMDTVIYGRNSSKVACIVCNNGEKMKETLLSFDLGVTEVSARGAYSSENKDMLICAFKPSKVSLLKKAITEIDKSAFVIICNADDVFGEGFAECNPNSL